MPSVGRNTLRYWKVDAFTDVPFKGNPAVVMPLDTWLPDSALQSISAEHNVSETAFFLPDGDGWRLRWFSPTQEVDICGHATMASAVVLARHLSMKRDRYDFFTRSGLLSVRTDGDRWELALPSQPPETIEMPDGLEEAIGATVQEVECYGPRYIARLVGADTVAALKPDATALSRLPKPALTVTAQGIDCDFVSRTFAPARGIPEDPVTGSAHCLLVPFWAKRLNKHAFHARQLSARGGQLWCSLSDSRVLVSGHAVTVAEGAMVSPV